MPTYIDPLLYGSLPTKPNTMGMEAVLTDKVDVGLLSEAVESLRERFPYFYVRPQIAGTDLVLAPNDLPVVVRDSWEPTILVSKETNYHVLSFKCEDKRLAAEVMHPVTDGSGFMPYFKSVLFCYLSKRYGIEFDRTGFRLPGDEIPASETGITLTRTLYKVEADGSLTELKKGRGVAVGDRLRVRLNVQCDRNLEYVELKEFRAACLEPVSTASGWVWTSGLSYYVAVNNSHNAVYIDRLEKGKYIIDADYYVTNPGSFTLAPSVLQCLYAPEFRATSPGQRIEVK
jgi:hypothetical protein